MYYDQIGLTRLKQIVGVSQEKVEDELCEMINNKVIHAKIDRLDMVVKFRLRKSEN